MTSTPDIAAPQDLPAPRRTSRIALAVALVALAAAPGTLGEVTRGQIGDAIIAVSSFVAATLLLFYGAEKIFGFDTGAAMAKARHLQVPIAAFLGVTPGCGGAVMVVSAYAAGRVGFGAMVATLIATMGDAAFLLIATRPDAAAVLLPVQFVAAVLTGWMIDRFVTADYRPQSGTAKLPVPRIGRIRPRDMAYLAVLAPALVLGVIGVTGSDIDSLFGIPGETIALIGGAIGLGIWATSPVKTMTHPSDPAITRMAEETAFISVWVVLAFLTYAYAEAFAGLNIHAMMAQIAIVVPLLAAVVGLIPGCGPQIVVTTMYLNGAIPFAGLVANAVSNDGDALFPAIALTPRAAILATLWSTIPALILAYGFMFFAPGLLN